MQSAGMHVFHRLTNSIFIVYDDAIKFYRQRGNHGMKRRALAMLPAAGMLAGMFTVSAGAADIIASGDCSYTGRPDPAV